MQVLSKAKLSFFAALHLKKFRYQERLFLAEGFKILQEAIASEYEIEAVIVRKDNETFAALNIDDRFVFEASDSDFNKLSTQVSPEGIISILRFPGPPLLNFGYATGKLPIGPAFILPAMQDPGNFGTILRTSEWFGMPSIICGAGTVDPYNPKVLRSSMGSLFRTQLHLFQNLEEWLGENSHLVWCADMQGEPLDSVNLSERPYILLGNESLGVSEEMRSLTKMRRITIPRFGAAESLNAATAAAVFAWSLKNRPS